MVQRVAVECFAHGPAKPDNGLARMADLCWYVFRVAPKRESAVRDLLSKRGFHALAPYTQEFDRVSCRRIVSYSEPVFPRYAFISVAGPQWDQLRSVPFLDPRPLGMDGRPYRMQSHDIEAIRRLGTTPIDSPKRPRTVQAGSAARIKAGSFAGHVVKVDAISGRKAKALLQLLGSLKAVEIPLAHLEAA